MARCEWCEEREEERIKKRRREKSERREDRERERREKRREKRERERERERREREREREREERERETVVGKYCLLPFFAATFFRTHMHTSTTLVLVSGGFFQPDQYALRDHHRVLYPARLPCHVGWTEVGTYEREKRQRGTSIARLFEW